MNELTQSEAFLARLVDDACREVLIGEPKRSAERVLDEGFRESTHKAIRLRRDDVAQLEVVFERGTIVEGGGGIDGPGLLRSAFELIRVLGAPFAGSVEVLQAEADGI